MKRSSRPSSLPRAERGLRPAAALAVLVAAPLVLACVSSGTHRQVVAERDGLLAEKARLEKRVSRLEATSESLDSERVALIDAIEDLDQQQKKLEKDVRRLRKAEARLSKSLAEREEAAVRLAEFSPAAIAPDALAPFPALLLVGGEMRRSASVADFTLAGPVAASARDVSSRIRHVAAAAGGLYALTDHDFGAVSPATGGLVEIGIDPRFEKEFSWPKGLAWDGASEKLVVMTSHVYTRFFTFDPRTAEWSLLPAERRDEQLIGLAWLREDGCLYALEVPGGGVRELDTVQRFNTTGAHLGTLRLEPPIPLPPGLHKGFQLHASSGMLVLMIPPHEPRGEAAAVSEARLYAIDPASGAVFAASPSP